VGSRGYLSRASNKKSQQQQLSKTAAFVEIRPLNLAGIIRTRSTSGEVLNHTIGEPLFDHLVGARKQRRRHGEAERIGAETEIRADSAKAVV
jgi:hypothetical protein